MELKFTKMQGIGNDFVVIDAINQSVELTPDLARRIADRRYGIGCDQILVVEPPVSDHVAFRYRIINADGSEVGQCGNGARCFARFVRDKGLIDVDEFAVETASGVLVPRLLENGLVQVDMGQPEFEPAAIPFVANAVAPAYALEVNGETLTVGTVSMGNPHVVLKVGNIDAAPVDTIGPALEQHPRFPERVNVGFMQIVSPRHIRLRVFERGAGETLACGSGACAAVVVGQTWGKLDSQVEVDLPGGQLMIERQSATAPVLMTGPAETVFEGIIEL
jgi:diaminopimelate epimerase